MWRLYLKCLKSAFIMPLAGHYIGLKNIDAIGQNKVFILIHL